MPDEALERAGDGDADGLTDIARMLSIRAAMVHYFCSKAYCHHYSPAADSSWMASAARLGRISLPAARNVHDLAELLLRMNRGNMTRHAVLV